ncbi:MAG: flagellar biosynthesis protein FlhF [Planctomycetes bacterium SCN 63-9]|nr:MAG: flagellar biosynthesis protein FlhF [Planctomycetes bacterium SCN 63-9]
MHAKIYRARTMKEALTRVRRDLGGEAVILASREVRHRRLFGLGTRELVEVTAADRLPNGETIPSIKVNGESPASHYEAPRNETSMTSDGLRSVFGEKLGRLHAMVEDLSRHGFIDHLLPELPTELVSTYAQLIEADVPEVLARRLVRHIVETLEPGQIHQADAVQAALCAALELCIPIAPPIRAIAGIRRIVALVGPTGVGKTTTVAKLAANFKLTRGIRVGLVTVDTYRIAAVEQLRTYAEIIDLPLAVVNHPGEMARALEGLGAVDLVFVDTAGRAPRDEPRIQELADFLGEARPDEIHLVLSAVAGQKSLRATVERFASIQADRLILTKLDEADGLGGVLAVLGQANRPISYVTTGQAVPDDFEPADRRRLARLILGLETIS